MDNEALFLMCTAKIHQFNQLSDDQLILFVIIGNGLSTVFQHILASLLILIWAFSLFEKEAAEISTKQAL